MSVPVGRYSLALLRRDDTKSGVSPNLSVVQAKKGLEWSAAVAELVANYGIATYEEAAALLDEAYRLDAGLEGTELSEVNTTLPGRVLRIAYVRHLPGQS